MQRKIILYYDIPPPQLRRSPLLRLRDILLSLFNSRMLTGRLRYVCPRNLSWGRLFDSGSIPVEGMAEAPTTKAPATKAPVTKAPDDKNPRRQKPQTTKAPDDKSPRRQKPQTTKAPDDKSPRRQKPLATKAPDDKSPRRQKPQAIKAPGKAIFLSTLYF